ncbi:MAG TPA: hypothetical protein ENJ55_01495 [Rhizobiales bacterium]|nr:hypothetical protein [Hyphomicrobiales bacterium]
MNILDTIRNSHDQQLVGLLAGRVNLPVDQVDEELKRIVPEIARAIESKTANDQQDFEHLLDVVDDEEQVLYLTDQTWTFSKAALEDGEDILIHVFGDLSTARNTLMISASDANHDDLMKYSATLSVAAMASRAETLGLFEADNEDSNDDGKPGLLMTILTAILAGLMQGILRKPRRRRRRYTYGRRTRRRTRRRRYTSRRRRSTSKRRRRRTRRRKTPSVTDLIGDLFRD